MELQQLNEHLSALRPEYYQRLNPALSLAAIEALEQHYQRILPDDLKTLYQWKNGQPDTVWENFVNNAMFLPLAEVLRIGEFLNGLIGFDFSLKNWWNEAWLPLFHNGGGSYICYDTEGTFTGKAGQILYFDKGYEVRTVLAASLSDFINALNNYYQNTKIADFDEMFKVQVPGYPLGYLLKEKLKKKKK